MDQVGAIGAVNRKQLTPEEQAEVVKLVARDREVRQHEARHMAMAGGMGGGIQYEYEMGPDGKRYAVGGHTRIAVSTGGTPEDVIATAQQLRSAARAPGEMSSQDMAVLASANEMEAEARQKLAEKRAEEGAASAERTPFSGFDALA
jgi:hypothetical protein